MTIYRTLCGRCGYRHLPAPLGKCGGPNAELTGPSVGHRSNE
jgi:hypothetical protein